MSDDIIKIVIGGAVLIGTGVFAWWLISKFWHDIREDVALWLRKNNLQESCLMDVLVKFDNAMGITNCKILVKTDKMGEHQITERTLTDKEIDALRQKEPDVYAQLRQQGYAEKNIMYMFQ